MSQYIKVSKIGASYSSGHSLVTLELNFTNISHGKFYWKHNNSLLTELEYLKTMNQKNGMLKDNMPYQCIILMKYIIFLTQKYSLI